MTWLAVFAGLVLFGVLLRGLWEWWAWNWGYCRRCGNLMERFEPLVYTGRVYVCSAYRHCRDHPSVWLSWPFIDRYRKI